MNLKKMMSVLPFMLISVQGLKKLQQILLTTAKFSTLSTSQSASDRIKKVREFLTVQQVDAFIIPTDDPHLSEYTAPFYNRREYISGFTGSAGTAVITKDKALLFTDGRYYTQVHKLII